MISKKIYLPALTLMILGSTMFVVSGVEASDNQHPKTDLIQEIAQKFNLNQSDVQQLFDDYRQQQ